MSVLEGSIGILPRRLMVRDADLFRARAVMADNGHPDGAMMQAPDAHGLGDLTDDEFLCGRLHLWQPRSRLSRGDRPRAAGGGGGRAAGSGVLDLGCGAGAAACALVRACRAWR
jgi:hypothetical protein